MKASECMYVCVCVCVKYTIKRRRVQWFGLMSTLSMMCFVGVGAIVVLNRNYQ